MHLEKLKMKLEHWAQHNDSHSSNIREQAEEAGKMGLQEIREELLSAAEVMDRAGDHIRRAMEKL